MPEDTGTARANTVPADETQRLLDRAASKLREAQAQRDQALNDRDDALDARDKALNKRDDALDARDKALAERDENLRKSDANADSAERWKAEAEAKPEPVLRKAIKEELASATWWRSSKLWIGLVVTAVLGFLALGALLLLVTIGSAVFMAVAPEPPPAPQEVVAPPPPPPLPIAFDQSRSWTGVGGQKVTLQSTSKEPVLLKVELFRNGQTVASIVRDIRMMPGSMYELSWSNFKGLAAGDEIRVTAPEIKSVGSYVVQ